MFLLNRIRPQGRASRKNAASADVIRGPATAVMNARADIAADSMPPRLKGQAQAAQFRWIRQLPPAAFSEVQKDLAWFAEANGPTRVR